MLHLECNMQNRQQLNTNNSKINSLNLTAIEDKRPLTFILNDLNRANRESKKLKQLIYRLPKSIRENDHHPTTYRLISSQKNNVLLIEHLIIELQHSMLISL